MKAGAETQRRVYGKIHRDFCEDDARWDNCFNAVNKAGVVKNRTITVYNPPEDPEEKKIYDRYWKKAKSEKS